MTPTPSSTGRCGYGRFVGLCHLVRSSCRAAVDRAQLVAIDREALARFADRAGPELVASVTTGPTFDQSLRPERSLELDLGIVIALDAVNFGSGYHDIVDKDPGLSGARTMARRLRSHLETVGSVSPDDLAGLTPERCAAIFGQRTDHPGRRELMELFAAALADLGRFVADRGGSFTSVVASAGGSAERLAESLLAMPFYRDRHPLDGEIVHFYKRAQITAADVAREVGHRPPCRFDDLDRLTAFADNLVPHVLRVDGVLRYDRDLAERIDRGDRLEAGSRAEVEIRAAGVVAVERLCAELGARGHPVRDMDVDLALWLRGAGHRYKAIPRHRTRSVFY